MSADVTKGKHIQGNTISPEIESYVIGAEEEKVSN